jgi:hypothetical protein
MRSTRQGGADARKIAIIAKLYQYISLRKEVKKIKKTK